MHQKLEDFQQYPVEIDLASETVRSPAEVEQVVYDPLAVVGLPDDDIEVFGKGIEPCVICQGGFFAEAAQQGLGVTCHRGERVVDLMGDACGKNPEARHFFRLDQLQFLHPFVGHVPEKNQRPVFLSQCVLDRGGGNVEIPGVMPLRHGNHGGFRPLATQSLFDGAILVRGVFGMEDILAGPFEKKLLREKLLADLVSMLNQPVVVKNDDAVFDRIENRLELVFLVS